MTPRIIPDDLLHRAKVINGLRQAADFLEAHPELPVAPHGWDLNIYTDHHRDGEASARAEIDRIAAILNVPVCDQTSQGHHCTAERPFGLISYRSVFIPERHLAEHRALMSYSGHVTPAVTE
jgi:plasmid stabilization system protein ParE